MIKNYYKHILSSRGSKYWYKNRYLHREGAPAVEFSSNYKAWYFNAKRHRIDGPAVTDGTRKDWYYNGLLVYYD